MGQHKLEYHLTLPWVSSHQPGSRRLPPLKKNPDPYCAPQTLPCSSYALIPPGSVDFPILFKGTMQTHVVFIDKPGSLALPGLTIKGNYLVLACVSGKQFVVDYISGWQEDGAGNRLWGKRHSKPFAPVSAGLMDGLALVSVCRCANAHHVQLLDLFLLVLQFRQQWKSQMRWEERRD